MKKLTRKVLLLLSAVVIMLTLLGSASQFAAMEVRADESKPALVVLKPEGKGGEGKDGPVYDGTEHVLVVPGIAYGGTMMYALGASDIIAPEDGWSTEPPTAKDIGTYYIWYYAKGDGAYEDSEKECVVTEIDQRTLGFHFLPTYKVKGEPEPDYNYTVTGLLEGDVVDYKITREPGEEPGVYSWYVEWPHHPYYYYKTLECPHLWI